MVRGKPYISANSATRKAAKAPNERQSRALRGLVKLKAKRRKTAELMSTSSQRPYAEVSWFIVCFLASSLRYSRDHHGRCHGRGAGADAAVGTGAVTHMTGRQAHA